MIISFDIDNTLIPYSNSFKVIPRNFKMRCLRAEPLRQGTPELFQFLQNQGHEIWIYTTSYRSVFQLKKTFWAYGLKPKRFINEKINRALLKSYQCKASKNPQLFGIDIHVDDAKGVEMEGEQYGFKTIIIDPEDVDWIEKVKSRL